MYAKLIEGVLEYAPINYTLSDGGIILNFTESVELMRQYDYKEVIDIVPSYNERTQYVDITGYEDSEDSITVNYVVRELPEQPVSITAEVEELQKTVAAQEETINTVMLATDELYTMVEPLLVSVSEMANVKGVSKMVDLYVAMVQRGLKTIDTVPVRYRDEVRRVLAELEK